MHDGTDVGGLEDAERGVREVVGELGELQVEAQVGLVGAVLAHRVGVRDAREGTGELDVDELPELGVDLLGQRDDVVLVDEAHLDVELGELGLPVGPEVLVAVAARDLVVPLETTDHQELLEQLRALRQGVPAAGTQARGHQEVAGALRGRAGQRGGLDLDELVAGEHVARGRVDLRAQAERRGRAGSTQVEVAVPQARLLADLTGAGGRGVVDRERQRCGGAEDLDVVGDDLDLARGDRGVLVAFRPALDRADDLEAVLGAQLVRDVLADHDLDDATGLTQVDERDTSVIASAGHPAGQRHLLANAVGGQGAGVMRADHGVFSWRSGTGGVGATTCGRRSSAGGVQVAGSASTWSPLRMSLTV